jgi:hypothetical protein
VGIDGRRAGGQLLRGTPGTDHAYFNPNDAANQDAVNVIASPPALGALVTVCLCFPLGLPRWARYTDAPGARVPRSPRGIPLVTASPFGALGQLVGLAVVTLPATVLGTQVACGGNVGGTVVPLYESTWNTSGPTLHQVRGGDAGGYRLDVGFPAVSAFTSSAQVATVALVAGTNFPAGAREVLVSFSYTSSIAASGLSYMQVYAGAPGGGAPNANASDYIPVYLPAGVGIDVVFTCWVPLASDYPTNGAATYKIALGTENASDAPVTAVNAQVIGWRY